MPNSRQIVNTEFPQSVEQLVELVNIISSLRIKETDLGNHYIWKNN